MLQKELVVKKESATASLFRFIYGFVSASGVLSGGHIFGAKTKGWKEKASKQKTMTTQKEAGQIADKEL